MGKAGKGIDLTVVVEHLVDADGLEALHLRGGRGEERAREREREGESKGEGGEEREREGKGQRLK
eukprot:3479477-Rhodomonas_salina.1